jgi:EmrB/QacA subfamily drug resistance transporter
VSLPEGEAGSASEPSTRSRWVLAAACLGAFVAFLDATIVNIAFPSLQHSFSASSREFLSWVLNAYNVVFAALLLPAGRLADRIGRRRAFSIGLILFGVASAACAAAPSAEVLVAVRAIQAVGAALLVPTSVGLLLDEYPLAERTRTIAILAAAAALAAASGPVLGGVLVDRFDWRAVFVVNLPVCAIALWVTQRHVRERRGPEVQGLSDLLSTALFAASMALMALALSRQGNWGWADGRTLGCLLGGVILLLAVVWRCRTHPRPALELSLFNARPVRMANVGIIVFAAAFYAKILIDVLFLTTIWHYSILGAGAAMTAGPLITTVVAPPAARLVDRWGTTAVAALGAVVYAGACAWYAMRAGTHADYLGVWLPGAVLTGTGIALTFPSLTTAAVADLPPRSYATGSALNASARQFGGVLGIAIAVSIIGGTTAIAGHEHFVHAWRYAGVCAALAAALVLILGPRTGPARDG